MAEEQGNQIPNAGPPNSEPIEMLLNMGPQHPSTHGVFRLVLWVDGEKIVDLEPHIGYLHRGSEKLCEGEQYNQVITLFDRMDYIANFNNEMAYCMAVEKLMGLEVPERDEYARVILCELNRIASHILYPTGLSVRQRSPARPTRYQRWSFVLQIDRPFPGSRHFFIPGDSYSTYGKVERQGG